MYIKRLELAGFKSFVEPTQVLLEPGVTAIVGPNGCGKSNIGDAIRWVLGEQSAKALRGKRMEDFIFNGTRIRRSSGMAEASLVIADADGKITNPGLREFSEISLGRRLHRSGESEYLINKTAVRLKDVVDVFLDLGVSADSLALLEQADIYTLLQAKPEERRSYVDGAAGIMKYKHRREEALRKLDATQQNLQRVGDIVGEVKRQMNSLSRQARKAEAYRRLRQELLHLEMVLLGQEYVEVRERTEASARVCEGLRVRIEGLAARKTAGENRVEEARLVVLERERDLAALRLELQEAVSNLERTQSRLEMAREQIVIRSKELERIEEELRELDERERQWEETFARRGRERAELSTELGRLEERRTASEEELNRLQAESRSVLQALEEKKTAYIDLHSGLSQGQAQLEALRARREEMGGRFLRLAQEETRIQEGDRESSTLLQGNAEKLRDIEVRVVSLRRQQADFQEDVRRKGEEFQGVENSLQEQRTRIEGILSRLHTLRDLQRNYEGFSQSVRSLLVPEEAVPSLPGLRGVVAEIVETSPRFEKAVEAALGEKLHCLLVDGHETALQAVSFLKQKIGGRGGFLPMNPKTNGFPTYSPNGNRGIVGLAVDLVRCPEEFRDAVRCLLGEVLIVESLDEALHLWQHQAFPGILVTLDGEILAPSGLVVGGGDHGESEGGTLLARRRLIQELESGAGALQGEIRGLEARREDLRRELERLQEEERGIAAVLREAEIEQVNCRRDVEQQEGERKRWAERLRTMTYEREMLEEEERRLSGEITGQEESCALLEQRRRQADEEIHRAQGDLAGLTRVIDEASSGLTELRVEIGTLREKEQGLASLLRGLAGEQEVLRSSRERLGIRGTEAREGIQSARETIAEGEKTLQDLLVLKDGHSAAIRERDESLSADRSRLEALEAEVKGVAAELEEIREEFTRAEIKWTEDRMTLKHLEDRGVTSYSRPVDEIVRLFQGEPEVDTEAWRQRAGELQASIQRLGEINMTALQEFQELSERHDFLTGQKEDLERSLQDLYETIRKINLTIREKFSSAFDRVKSNFESVFTRLFGGGEATLLLTKPDEPLESGIDIAAQPPGKKLQNLALLSAGEKALTALSFLFAIFLVNPSPFCILDEVDAPLDEANVQRFGEMVRELSSQTQFLIVTHNKRTMALTDRLYGVTMSERGVSQLVSVSLNGRAAA